VVAVLFGAIRPKVWVSDMLGRQRSHGVPWQVCLAHLFVFMTNRAVPYTNNVSERHLRPGAIFRKVTNGFRCEWGAEIYAAFRAVVSTAKANRACVLDTVRFVISAKRPGDRLAGAR
jgi:hypothetical protein